MIIKCICVLLGHLWIVDDNVALDKPLDFAALSSSRSSSVIHNNLFVFLCSLGEKDLGIIFELQDNLQVSEERTVRRCLEVSTRTPYECISIPKDKLWGKMEDLHREIEIMKLLSEHPNTARIKGAYEDQRVVYIVKELCARGDFFNLFVEKEYYSEKRQPYLLRQLSKWLNIAILWGVTHRDINPDSFLFSNVDQEAPLKATSFRFFTFYKPKAHSDKLQSNGLADLDDYKSDLVYLKRKVDAGTDVIISQLFFDTDIFLKFVKDCREEGISCPIVPDILPITTYRGYLRMIGICKTWVHNFIPAYPLSAMSSQNLLVDIVNYSWFDSLCSL
ncbi:hypothetical protein GIB67_042666 [Kingdonia uniflora]|uniref:Methylenetetrahydrofolate reductase n=1 Tax=Kingdonia uniflora TaxID=39325 RepID=A0A7J7P260_9MAGN|nr:hypothetical protein GIB67_042666 [Kingdonia uniflora]